MYYWIILFKGFEEMILESDSFKKPIRSIAILKS